MKRLILIIAVFLTLCFSVQVFGATINVPAPTSKPVGKSPVENQLTYEIPSVASGVTQVFRLTIPISYGYINDITFDPSNDNCTVWVSESETLAATSNLARIEMNIDTGYYSPEILPRKFANKEANPNQYKLYFTVRNSGTQATKSPSPLILTLGSK